MGSGLLGPDGCLSFWAETPSPSVARASFLSLGLSLGPDSPPSSHQFCSTDSLWITSDSKGHKSILQHTDAAVLSPTWNKVHGVWPELTLLMPWSNFLHFSGAALEHMSQDWDHGLQLEHFASCPQHWALH